MKDLDLTMDNMENSRFIYHYDTIIARMESPIFSRLDMLCLSMIYHKFLLQNGPRAKYMTAIQLKDFIQLMFKISDQRMCHLIATLVCKDPDCMDPKFNHDYHCTLNSFIRMFTVYCSNDIEMRMRFAFSVYDAERLGYLNREHVMRFIVPFFVGDDEDEINEMSNDMLELLFAKFDLDRDLIITFEEYAEVVRDNPSLLEFLGTIFPSVVQMNVVRHCINLLA